MLRTPAYGRIFFEADSGASGGNAAGATSPGAGTPPSTEDAGVVTFTEAQQKEINRLIGNARKEGRTAAEQAAADAETARQAEAARQAAEAKGEFETVKQSLTKERDDANAANASLKASLDAANAVVVEQVEAVKKSLPAELLTGYPADGTPLEQLAWLKDRKQVFDVAVAASGAGAANVTRLPATPGGTNQSAVDAAYDRMRNRISI